MRNDWIYSRDKSALGGTHLGTKFPSSMDHVFVVMFPDVSGRFLWNKLQDVFLL
jgi:hypothetical protein